MFTENIHILIVDDDSNITDKLYNYFRKKKYVPYVARCPSEAHKILKENIVHVCFIDVLLPEYDGIELLKNIKSNFPQIEITIISGHGNMNVVIDALRYGASDFIKKPFNYFDIDFSLTRTKKFIEIQNRLQNSENESSLLSRELENLIDRQMIGESSQIKEVLEMALLAGSDNDINVLITGENGTGKEIIARIIHFTSTRKRQLFYPINSTAIPDTLLESEFFGHNKGAFTDAREDKRGLFELTDRGTLFLDEIADMPLALQSKLLRVLEDKTVRPLGSDRIIKVDTRIITATNRDIELLISENKFRRDLYHRINTFIIHIPPLRSRPQDIRPLVSHFIEFYAKKKNRSGPTVDELIIDKLEKYAFPGNVRELKNMIERAFLVSNKNKFELKDFFVNYHSEFKVDKSQDNLDIESNEKILIEKALSKAEFNQVEAAKYLGISRDALIRRIKKHNISIEKLIL